jgi:hypothetical protein
MASRIKLAVAATAALVIVGVATAPHYNYSAVEEMNLNDALRPFGEQSQGIVDQQNAAVAAWTGTKGSGAGLRSLVVGKLVPFYTSAAATLDGLRLRSGTRTDRRRKALSSYAHLNLESYDHLLAAIKASDASNTAERNRELAAFSDRMAKASRALLSDISPNSPDK